MYNTDEFIKYKKIKHDIEPRYRSKLCQTKPMIAYKETLPTNCNIESCSS